MIKKDSRAARRKMRHRRVRKKVYGTPDIPRLSVFKSLKHFYAQIIDDDKRETLYSASLLTPEVRAMLSQDNQNKSQNAKKLGKYVGEKALSKGIKKVCFDRAGYRYHGRVKAFADGAREAGLEF